MTLNHYQQISDEEIKSIDLRSDEVEEIMGHIPNRLIRFGIVIIALVVAGLISFSFVFRYPEIINGSFYLQTKNPPAFLLSRSTGKLQELFVSEGDSVKRGDLLAIIENPASRDGYYLLKRFTNIDKDSLFEGECMQEWEPISEEMKFGELQVYFSEVLKAVSQYRILKRIDYYDEKRKAVSERMAGLRKREKLLMQQIDATERAFEIDRKILNRDSVLYASNVIAEVEYENARKEYFTQEKELINNRLNLSSVQLTLSELEQELLELNLNEQESTEEHLSAIKVAFDNLKASISEWETKYCLISPVDGIVALSGVWEENQNVNAGQLVMAVLPEEATTIVGKLNIPIHSAGKVNPGQVVNLKFADFPYQEFGMVVATLDELSAVPDTVYVGTVFLPDTLVTNYNKHLPFKQNMQGVAEIITEEVSLAKRLIFPLKAILKENIQ